MTPEEKTDVYWAAEVDSEKVAAAAWNRVRRYRTALKESGRADRMRRAWAAYKGWGPRNDADASRALAAGESGEMVSLNVNQFAAMVNQAVVLTTSNKPAIKAVPINGDFESRAQAQFADSLSEYYDRELSLSDREREAALGMVLLSEAWEVLDWDATAGEEYMPADDGAKPVRTGDARVYICTPLDVAVDPDVSDLEQHRWIAWRRPVNKWDLAAQYPKARDAILGARLDEDNDVERISLRARRRENAESDCVMLWELRHVPSPALPNGRRLLFLDSRTVIADSVMRDEAGVVQDYGYPFGKELNAFSVSPERLPGEADGHTGFFDLLSLQEGVDLSASIMMSAINSGGLQNLYVPRGANITANKLTGALNVIEFDGDTVPQAKENVAINPAVQAWAEMCVSWMRQRASLNDVVMGEPTKGMPAQAMALLRAQAVEFHSSLQASYERLIQRGRTGILRMLQKYATTERVALISGKGNAWALRHFSSKDLRGVAHYVAEPVPAALRTLAGKVAFAMPLLESGRITIDEFLQLTETGRLEPILRFEQDNFARIQRDKEMLMRGIGLPPTQMVMTPLGPQPMLGPDGLPVFADDGGEHLRPLITDTHWVDIPEYLGVLAMPEVRDNPAVVKAVTEAVALKTQMWRQMDPAIIVLLKGMPPPPPVMGPPGMPPPPGSMGPPSGPPPMPGQPPGAPSVSMPQPPKNPLTGERDLTTPPPGVA